MRFLLLNLTPVVEVETTDPVDMVEPVIEVVDTVVPQPPEEAETLDDDTTA
jgi:hypothetical protein